MVAFDRARQGMEIAVPPAVLSYLASSFMNLTGRLALLCLSIAGFPVAGGEMGVVDTLKAETAHSRTSADLLPSTPLVDGERARVSSLDDARCPAQGKTRERRDRDAVVGGSHAGRFLPSLHRLG